MLHGIQMQIVRNSRRSSVLEEAADAKLLGVVQERDILSLELDEIKQELHVALENEAALDVERGMLSLEVDIITVELHEALALPDMMKTDLMKAEENIRIAEENIRIAEKKIRIAEEKIKIAEENEAALDVEVKTLRAEVERLQQEADKKTKKSRWFS